MKYRFKQPNACAFGDVLALNQLYVRKDPVRRWTNPLFRLCLAGLGVGFIGFGLVSLRTGGTGEAPLWQSVAAPVGVGLLWAALGLFYPRLSAWKISRRTAKAPVAMTIVLDEDGVTTKNKKGTDTCPYSAFAAAYEYRERWFLFLDARRAVILPRAVMTEGDPAAFADFWLSKTGKPVKKFK